MKGLFYTFFPVIFFMFFTVILFFYLKEDGSTPTYKRREPQIKELFRDNKVKKDTPIKKENYVKQSREYIVDDENFKGTLEVLDVRWHQHKGFERLVFDISAKDNDVGICKIEPDVDHTDYIKGELVGYKRFTPYLPTFASSKLIDYMRVVKNSKNNFVFTIKFFRPVSYKAFALKDPARIVIDIY